jgi:hypothetical protein
MGYPRRPEGLIPPKRNRTGRLSSGFRRVRSNHERNSDRSARRISDPPESRRFAAVSRLFRAMAGSCGSPRWVSSLGRRTPIRSIRSGMRFLARDKSTRQLFSTEVPAVDFSFAVSLGYDPLAWAPFSILAHVSRSVTVRLNTGLPGSPSGSAQK